MWGSQDDLSSQFEANPCITGPFMKDPRPSSFSQNTSGSVKKNVHQWLRLQEIYHRIKDCETDEEKSGLYISKLIFIQRRFVTTQETP